MEILVFYLILGIYLMEFPKIFSSCGNHKVRFGFFAAHFAVAIASAGTLFLFYKKSALFLSMFGEYFAALVLITALGLIISLSASVLTLLEKKSSALF